MFYAKGPSATGVWRLPLEGGSDEQVLSELKPGLFYCWDLTREDIYFLDADRAGRRSIRFFSFSTGGTSPLVDLDSPIPQPPWFTGGLTVSPDGRWLVYAQMDHMESDIMLVENFR